MTTTAKSDSKDDTKQETKRTFKLDAEGELDITGLDEARILRALFNATKPKDLSIMHHGFNKEMELAEARAVFDKKAVVGKGRFFDYVKGHSIKVIFRAGKLERLDLFDRDNGGPGVGLEAIAAEFKT